MSNPSLKSINRTALLFTSILVIAFAAACDPATN